MEPAERHTICTLAFPLSRTVRGKGASRPVAWSFRRRKAWCGRFALPFSLAVRVIVMVSWAPRETGFLRGDWGPNLLPICQQSHILLEQSTCASNSRFFGSLASSLLVANGNSSVLKSPRGSSLDSTSCQQQKGRDTSNAHVVWLVWKENWWSCRVDKAEVRNSPMDTCCQELQLRPSGTSSLRGAKGSSGHP